MATTPGSTIGYCRISCGARFRPDYINGLKGGLRSSESQSLLGGPEAIHRAYSVLFSGTSTMGHNSGAKTSIVYSNLSQFPGTRSMIEGLGGKNDSCNTNLAEVRRWLLTSRGTQNICSTSSGIYIGEWQKKAMILPSNRIQALWSNSR